MSGRLKPLENRPVGWWVGQSIPFGGESARAVDAKQLLLPLSTSESPKTKKARAASALGAIVTTRTMVRVSIVTLGLVMVNNVEISLAPSSLSLSLSHTYYQRLLVVNGRVGMVLQGLSFDLFFSPHFFVLMYFFRKPNKWDFSSTHA